MVAPNTLRPFYKNQLVAFLAWRHRAGETENFESALLRGSSDGPSSRTLSPNEAQRFVRYRDDKPGSCLVDDASGAAWVCPVNFLAPSAP